ncbi:hypothetical protein [Litoreibacter roseus]|uniref:Uncharacterized protein n=1 Tax=Litoreibacter roseus TaxID=2601869 RepID=A0A6N6JD40_9RHOB|nr:hypothetical protein [Litoreibacter roseus]GFE63289.1 hypothetical protein KIN_03630 [Litoreibacter roseus]
MSGTSVKLLATTFLILGVAACSQPEPEPVEVRTPIYAKDGTIITFENDIDDED